MKKLIFVLVLTICYLVGFTQKTGTFTDVRDGKVYKTVKIGKQWIMAENFAYKPEKGKYWVYKNEEENLKKYGYLYTEAVANSVAPIGWHLPSIGEWDELYNYLGGNYSEVFQALSKGGSSGFNLLLGGMHSILGFSDMGEIGFYRSSSPNWIFNMNTKVNTALPSTLWANSSYKIGEANHEKCGFSVRLFKDLNDSEVWDWAKTANTNQGYLDYLNLYPAGIYADSARQQISKVKEQIGIVDTKIITGLSIEEVISILSMNDVLNRNTMGGLYIGMGVFPENANEKSSYSGNASIDGYDIVFEKGTVISKKIVPERIGSKKANFSYNIK